MEDALPVSQVFDRGAASYDATRRQLIPCFDELYGTAVALIGAAEKCSKPLRILDLGAGTGLLSAMARESFPNASLRLMDVSESMLGVARRRFEGEADRVELIVADFTIEPLVGPYDAVVSALAIHHLTHAAKRRLFARIHASLRPGGRFVNADQIRGPTAEREHAYQASWLRAVRRAGVPEPALAAAQERMRHDITAPLEDQLRWLRGARFTDVDCAFKSGMFGVFFARRPRAGGT